MSLKSPSKSSIMKFITNASYYCFKYNQIIVLSLVECRSFEKMINLYDMEGDIWEKNQ